MTYIKSRKHPVHHPRSGGVLTGATLLAGVALGLPSVASAAADDLADDPAVKLSGVTVTGDKVEGYKTDRVASPKFTQPLKDTPQTIQIITSDLFNQQGATTLSDALLNTPGAGTFYAGENGNTTTGDAIYMRGFDTSNSLYVDGVRDIGSISRDVFNIEQIEVIKGPAGTDNGRSAPSGSINLVSKHANLSQHLGGTIVVGTDGQKRTTFDANRAFAGLPGSAARLNLMWEDSDVPGRDHVENKRWGIAPSLAFGLESDTRVFLNLLYVDQENVPDGRVPTIGLPGWTPQEGLEALVGHPIDSENFYGTKADHDDVKAQMVTFRVEHAFSDALLLTNTARWGKTEQDYLLTAFMSTNTNIVYDDVDDLSSYTIARSLPTFKDQDNSILTNQLNLRADFATGGVEHFLSTGLEFIREKQTSMGQAATNETTWPAANLYDPEWDVSGLTWGPSGTDSEGKTTTGALYAFDTLKFGEHLLVTGGARVDRYKTETFATRACGGTSRGAVACPEGVAEGTIIPTIDDDDSDTLFSWKLGAVYKFGETVSLYANYAISQQPPGGANFTLSTSATSLDNPNMDPQKAKTAEIGSKWALAGGGLALDLSAFRTTVTNEINTDDLDEFGNPTQTGEKRVQGVEISVVGSITDAWQISAGYTRLDTEVEEGPAVSVDGSNNLTYTPDYSFTSWTSYNFPFGLTIGGGVRVMDGLHRGTDGAVGTPATTESYTVIDAMVSYAVSEHLTLRANGYNLADEEYVASINKSGYRYAPGAPRTWLFTAIYDF